MVTFIRRNNVINVPVNESLLHRRDLTVHAIAWRIAGAYQPIRSKLSLLVGVDKEVL